MRLDLENNTLRITTDYGYDDDNEIYPSIVLYLDNKDGASSVSFKVDLDKLENLEKICNYLSSELHVFKKMAEDYAKNKI